MPTTSRRPIEITDPLGLHFRPAGAFVRTAQQFRAAIRVVRDGRAVDGKSILDLMTLAAEFGTRLELEACGPDAEEALAALCGLVQSGADPAGDGQRREASGIPVAPIRQAVRR